MAMFMVNSPADRVAVGDVERVILVVHHDRRRVAPEVTAPVLQPKDRARGVRRVVFGVLRTMFHDLVADLKHRDLLGGVRITDTTVEQRCSYVSVSFFTP